MRFLYKHCFWAYYLLTENLGVSFPSTIPKTGEVRVQNAGELLLKYSGTKCVVTEKIDGESFTAYLNNGVFGVCSHGVDLDLNVKGYHTELATKLKLEERMRMFSEESNLPNFAIQGELAGPGIRGNRQGLKERDIYFFNVYNIDNQTHMCYEDSLRVIEEMRLSFVPVLSKWFVLPDNIDELVRLSHGVTALSETFVMLREGLVIRPLKEYRDFTIPGLERGRVSFKVISPEYLLKYGE